MLVGQTTPVEFALKVASLAESITVTGASPTVDTTSANVNVNLSEQLLQGTPGGRDIWALVEAKVPGLVISRPDVGGTSGGLQGTFSARGTTSAQNTSFLNGVNVGDPAAIGAAGFYYDFDAFDDIQVSTGAHDITVPTSGVFLNMITKTGGNKWNGASTFTWTGDSLQGAQRHNPDLAEVRLPAGRQHVRFRLGHQRHGRRAARPEQAALLRLVPRLARAPERAGAELGSRARPDQHHLGPGERHVAGESEQPVHRLLLASALQQAEPAAEQRVDHGHRFHRATKKTCSISCRACGTRVHRQELLHRRAPRDEQDSLPDLFKTAATSSRSPTMRRVSSTGTSRPKSSATAIAIRPTPPASTTSIRRSAAGTSSSSASTTRTPSRRTKRTASTTCARSTTAR